MHKRTVGIEELASAAPTGEKGAKKPKATLDKKGINLVLKKAIGTPMLNLLEYVSSVDLHRASLWVFPLDSQAQAEAGLHKGVTQERWPTHAALHLARP